MLTGHVDDACRQYISGWAYDSENPDAKVEVVVLLHGAEQGRVIADRMRPDLQKLGKYGDGCHGFFFRFDQPLSVIGTYDIVVQFAAGGVLERGRFRIARQPSEPSNELRPIILTATGRSGTSLLMRRLWRDSSIVVAGDFPYEIKLLSYYTKAFEILTATGNHEKSVSADLIFDDPYRLGLNPFNHHLYAQVFPAPAMIHGFFERQAAPIIAEAFKAVIGTFYQQVNTANSKRGARFFAEKCEVFNPTRDFTRLAFGDVHEIILVRDPRDIFCSYRSFWSVPGQQALQNLGSVRNRVLDFHKETTDDRLFLRYEDLVCQPDETMQRISGFLNLDHVAEIDHGHENEDFKGHATSQDALSSIGRWRRELTDSERQVFDSEFAEFFETFGYDRAG